MDTDSMSAGPTDRIRLVFASEDQKIRVYPSSSLIDYLEAQKCDLSQLSNEEQNHEPRPLHFHFQRGTLHLIGWCRKIGVSLVEFTNQNNWQLLCPSFEWITVAHTSVLKLFVRNLHNAAVREREMAGECGLAGGICVKAT
jgi:hypothetical protein